MKISFYPSTRTSELPEGIDSVHIVRPVGRKKFSSFCRKNPGIERVSMSKSCYNRTSSSFRAFLEKKEIELTVNDEKGRAISIPLPKMLSVIEMRRDFRSLREIEKSTGIPKSTVHYLVKHAKKKKIKNGKNVIYLQ